MIVARKLPKPKSRAKIPTARRLSPLKARDVTRAEYNELVDILNKRGVILEGLRRELDTQFKRIAQMQSELDEVRRVWVKSRAD